jgi:hypothetical protein
MGRTLSLDELPQSAQERVELNIRITRMSIKAYLALLLAAACGGAAGQSAGGLESKMHNNCQALAKELNKSKNLGISPEGMLPLVTWHAACAERPPTGPGDVTALCEGKRVTAKGAERIFFWQKSKRGKLNKGYFMCTD